MNMRFYFERDKYGKKLNPFHPSPSYEMLFVSWMIYLNINIDYHLKGNLFT